MGPFRRERARDQRVEVARSRKDRLRPTIIVCITLGLYSYTFRLSISPAAASLGSYNAATHHAHFQPPIPFSFFPPVLFGRVGSQTPTIPESAKFILKTVHRGIGDNC